jgi:hypothetical protein
MFWSILQYLAQFFKIKIKSGDVEIWNQFLGSGNKSLIQLGYNNVALILDTKYI